MEESSSLERLKLEGRLKSGAGWFYWIAALSLVNSVAALAGSDWGFIIGLAVTRVFDAIGQNLGAAGKLVVFGLDLVAAAAVVAFGVFAGRRCRWSFVLGMVLYAADGLLLLVVRDVIGIGFHVFALVCIAGGMKAASALEELDAQERRYAAFTPPDPGAGPYSGQP